MNRRDFALIKLEDIYQKSLASLTDNSGYSAQNTEDYLQFIATNPFIKDIFDSTSFSVELKSFIANPTIFSQKDKQDKIKLLHRRLLDTARTEGYTVKLKIIINLSTGELTLDSNTPKFGKYKTEKQNQRWKILKNFLLLPNHTFSRADIANAIGKKRIGSFSIDIARAIEGVNKQFRTELGGLQHDIIVENKHSRTANYKLNTVDYEIEQLMEE